MLDLEANCPTQPLDQLSGAALEAIGSIPGL